MKKKIILYKSKNFSELLNDCTEFIRQSFGIYSKAFLYILVPPLLIVMVIDTYMFNHMAGELSRYTGGGYKDGMLRLFGALSKGTIVPQLLSVVMTMIQATLVYNYIVLYERADDPAQITVADIWDHMRQGFVRVLWSYVVLTLVVILAVIIAGLMIYGAVSMSTALAVVLGMAMFCVMMFLLVPLSLFVMIRVKEDVSLGGALQRSMILIRGRWWQTAGVLMVAGLVVGSFATMCIMPLTIINGIGQISRLSHKSGSPLDLGPLYDFTQALSQALYLYFSALVSMCVAVIYYSLSEDKDNVALLQEINTIGENPEAASAQDGEY